MKIEDLQGTHNILIGTDAASATDLEAEVRIEADGVMCLWFSVYRDGVMKYETPVLSAAVRKFNEVAA